MTKRELGKILQKYYSTSMVKKVRAGLNKPSDEMKTKLEDNEGIPFGAWKNIRAWLTEQETKKQIKATKKALK